MRMSSPKSQPRWYAYPQASLDNILVQATERVERCKRERMLLVDKKITGRLKQR